MNREIIGTWKADSLDSATIKNYGNAILQFCENGELIYTMIDEIAEHQIFLTYEVDGSKLITDQPSHPQREETEFVLTQNRLELNFDGIWSKYVKLA